MTWPQKIDRVELSNGRSMTVCALHQLVTCGKCCLDFSFDNSDDGHAAYEALGLVKSADKPTPDAYVHSGFHVVKPEPANPKAPNMIFETPEKTKHSGAVFPSRFGQRRKKPISPAELFPASSCVRVKPNVKRFINRYDSSECLIYTDGACFDNGAADARGGCGIFFKPTYINDQSGSVAFKLEDRGPDGKAHRHTSNRAELRAVIAALRYRAWQSEGFRSVVIATDSTYVVNGATGWAPAWIRKGWQLSTGAPVKNRDLWEALLLDVEKLYDRGVHVRFWWIPRKFNHVADRAAKGAAAILMPTDNFTDVFGDHV
ncbi:Ribonuclease H [Colletotrichum tanaceti]|uniref:ribonuclease H n=1 Tax=Colletotrichum tanaceti TaxID=1306861 RepID=A0A4U6X6V3_9PEZI|nr:Ribonuclease H [Colletotrichum tanaceti]